MAEEKDLFLNVDATVVKYRPNSTFVYDTLSLVAHNVRESDIEDYQTSVFTLAAGASVDVSFEGIAYADFLMILAPGAFQLDLLISTIGFGDGGWGDGGFGGGTVASGVCGKNIFLTYGPYESVTIKNDSSAAYEVQVMAVKLST
jgi:hypothetical protein